MTNDAFKPPRPPRGLDLPSGAAPSDNTEFMHGRVGVIIIFPESNGAIDANDFNWTPEMISNCLSEIQNGMNWWKTMAGDTGKLEFRYFVHDSDVNIAYETIDRNMGNESGDQALVLGAILQALGQPVLPTPFEALKTYNNLIRRQNPDLDWVTTCIVVNDGNNASKRFKDSSLFAFAYFGGPFFIQTYSNAGWGISNMDLVSAHEFGHIFYALDEYSSAGMVASETSGYIPERNENTLAGGGTYNEATCIMRSSGFSIGGQTCCMYSRNQCGLTDSDADFIPDVLDLDPVLQISTLPPSSTDSSGFVIAGSCFAESLVNRNPYGNRNNMTLNEVDSVEYRIDSGAWRAAVAEDGAFDTPLERFTAHVTGYSWDTHVIEIRGTALVGHDTTRLKRTRIASATFYSNFGETSIEPSSPSNGVCTNATSPLLTWRGWNRADVARYRVQFSDSPVFSSIVATCTTVGPETALACPLPMGNHYWRAIGIHATGMLETSAPRRIWIDTAPPNRPTVLSPRPDSSFAKRQPRVTTGDVADTGCGVASVVVSLSSHPAFASDTVWILTETSALVISADSGRVYVRVALRDSATNQSAWSDSVSFLLGTVGDFNGNAVFEAEDLFSFALRFGETASGLPAADLDENGTIDASDVRILLEDRRR